ncbi:MAG: ABC transporter permease [Bacteroidota bacterium]|nr:ABC transporter permease [Bacteroidota bacterium]
MIEQQKRAISIDVWKQYKKHKAGLAAIYILAALIIIALFADVIANDQPLYARYRGQNLYPAFSSGTLITTNPKTGKNEKLQYDITDWRALKLDGVLWAPIPYSPGRSDPYNRGYRAPGDRQAYKNENGDIVEIPGRFRHFLGTDQIGQDVAAVIIHGTRVSLSIGIVAVGIAAVIGITLGAIGGYFGDHSLRKNRMEYWLFIAGLFLGYFYAFTVREHVLKEAMETSFLRAIGEFIVSIFIFISIPLLLSQAGRLLSRFSSKKVEVPMDNLISRSIEVVDSLPKLLIILTLASLLEEKSIYTVMIIIGLTSWTGIARFTRADFLRNRNLNYVESAKGLGYSDSRIIFSHILPNAMAPVYVSIAFGISSAILIESSLSFLGIGVPRDKVTWGSMLYAGQQNVSAWWLIVFPGIAIFITVTVFNLMGEGLRDALDPKLKR